jgi:GNAT superfamily N-acetyltransferase
MGWRTLEPNAMPSTTLIRGARADDVARIRAIARAAYAKYVARIGHEPAPMAANYDAEVAAHHVVVIEVAGTVDGYMVAWPEDDTYFIDNIGVEPSCQGTGLGRRLLEYAAAEAERLHLPALRLYTNIVMVENLAMYAHLGFVETHRVVEKGFNRIYLRRSLAKTER